MVTNNADQALDRVFELIEADKLDDARAALKPILETNRDNPDAWWLYAHAVTDIETARLALTNVLRLDSQYPEAAELLSKIQAHPAIRPLSAHDNDSEPSFLPASPSTLPGMGDTDEPDLDRDETTRSRSGTNMLVLVLIAVVIVIALIIVVVRPFAPSTPAATSVVQNPTAVSGTGENTAPTSESQTASGGDFEGLRPALSAYDVPDNGLNVKSTNLGNTLVVDICTKAGPELRTALPAVMDVLSGQNSIYAGKVDAVGVQMLDCTSNTPLLVIGVPASDATAYAANSITKTDFQAKWKPII